MCGKTLPRYKRHHDADNDEYDEALNCPDGSDELCGDPCVSDGFTGRFTIKVCRHVLMDTYLPIWLSDISLLFSIQTCQPSRLFVPPFFPRNAVKMIQFAFPFSGIVMVKMIVQRDQMKEIVLVNSLACQNAILWII